MSKAEKNKLKNARKKEEKAAKAKEKAEAKQRDKEAKQAAQLIANKLNLNLSGTDTPAMVASGAQTPNGTWKKKCRDGVNCKNKATCKFWHPGDKSTQNQAVALLLRAARGASRARVKAKVVAVAL